MKNPTKKVIIAVLVCSLVVLCSAYTVSAQSTIVKAEASASEPHVGDTITVNIKIYDVQNLYGVDVTLNWNPSVLEVTSVTPKLGVESNPDGVLHESSTYPLKVVDNTPSQADGQYHLAVTSTGSTTPAFSGSGAIATLTFNVTSQGQTGLSLSNAELSERTSSGDMDLVTPQTSVSTVDVAVPEFPVVALIGLAIIAVTVSALAVTLLRRRMH